MKAGSGLAAIPQSAAGDGGRERVVAALCSHRTGIDRGSRTTASRVGLGPMDLQPVIAVVDFLQDDVELPQFLDVAEDFGRGVGVEQPAALDAMLQQQGAVGRLPNSA